MCLFNIIYIHMYMAIFSLIIHILSYIHIILVFFYYGWLKNSKTTSISIMFFNNNVTYEPNSPPNHQCLQRQIKSIREHTLHVPSINEQFVQYIIVINTNACLSLVITNVYESSALHHIAERLLRNVDLTRIHFLKHNPSFINCPHHNSQYFNGKWEEKHNKVDHKSA